MWCTLTLSTLPSFIFQFEEEEDEGEEDEVCLW